MDYQGLAALTMAGASLLAVLSNLILGWRTSTKVDQVVTKVDVVERQVAVSASVADETLKQVAVSVAVSDETLAETKVVKGHVNSASDRADGIADGLRKDAEGFRREMGLLREQLGEEKQRSALLAQSIAAIATSTTKTASDVSELNGHTPVNPG